MAPLASRLAQILSHAAIRPKNKAKITAPRANVVTAIIYSGSRRVRYVRRTLFNQLAVIIRSPATKEIVITELKFKDMISPRSYPSGIA